MKEYKLYYQIEQRRKMRIIAEIEFTNSKDAIDCHLASVKYDYYIGKIGNILYYQFNTELEKEDFLNFVGKEYEQLKGRKVIKYDADSKIVQVKKNGKVIDYE